MEMFSFSITKTELSQSSPIKGYDVCYSDFRGCEIYKVPILNIYGTTQAGQKGCLHVHGVFPYMCLRWFDVFPEVSIINSRKYLQELALEIDKALNVDAGRSSSSKHHVYNIIIIKAKLFYGFSPDDEDFLKIYFYNPNDVSRTIDILTKSKVLKKVIQPYYAHIPFKLQFYTDYNLSYGTVINISSYQFRAPNKIHSSSHGVSSLLSDSKTSLYKVWDISSLTSSQINGIPRETDQELELDCLETSILNKRDALVHLGKNPGIVAIWEEERRRKKLEGNSSQFTPMSTIERIVEESESEIHHKNLFNRLFESNTFKQYEENERVGDVKDSQNSLNHMSSESFTFSNTQEKEILDMCISMYTNLGPDDDSILAVKNDSVSDDEEVTLEMSQQFTDEILNDIPPNSHSGNQMTDSGMSANQRQQVIPQLDGAFDDEKSGSKQDKQSESTDEKSSIIHHVHSRDNQCNRNTQGSVEISNVENGDAAKQMAITKANEKQVKRAKKPSMLNVCQDDKKQMKKLNASVSKCLTSIITKVEKILNDGSESLGCHSKECESETSNTFTQSDPCPNPCEDKTKLRKEECFTGARPKTTKNIPSLYPKDYKSIHKKKNSLIDGPPVLSIAPNSATNVSESPATKLSLSINQKLISSNSNNIKTSSSNHRKPPLSCSELCDTETSDSQQKEICDVITDVQNTSLSSSKLCGTESSDSHQKEVFGVITDVQSTPSSSSRLCCTESSDSQQKGTFDAKTDTHLNALVKIGSEHVVLKRLTKKEISAATAGSHETGQKSAQKGTSNNESHNKEKKQNKFKNSHKNKQKFSKPDHVESFGKQLSEIKSNPSILNNTIPRTNIKNSKKNGLHNVNSKNYVCDHSPSIVSAPSLNSTIHDLSFKILNASSFDKKFSPCKAASHISEHAFNNSKIKTSNIPSFSAGIMDNNKNSKGFQVKALSLDSLTPKKMDNKKNSDIKNSTHHHNYNLGNVSNIQNKKGKNFSDSKKKKKSRYHLNKKHMDQDIAKIQENFDVDSKKDLKETCKHSLQERNIDYFPTGNVEPLNISHTKFVRNEPRLLIRNVEAEHSSVLHQVTELEESAKIQQLYVDIIKNQPVVSLRDIFKDPKHHDQLEKLILSNKAVHRYSEHSLRLGKNESNISPKGTRKTNSTYSKNNHVISLPTNATKQKQSSVLHNSCGKNQGYQKHNSYALPLAIKSKPTSTSASEINNLGNTSFSGELKTNPKLKVHSSRCVDVNEDCPNAKNLAVKSKYRNDTSANDLFRNEIKTENSMQNLIDIENNSKSNLIFPHVSYSIVDNNTIPVHDERRCFSKVRIALNDSEVILNESTAMKNIKLKPGEFSEPNSNIMRAIPNSIKNFSYKNHNSKVNSCKSGYSLVEKLKTEKTEPDLKHTNEVYSDLSEDSKTSHELKANFALSHILSGSKMKKAIAKDNGYKACNSGTVIVKAPETKSVKESDYKSKFNADGPIRTDLYDVVKSRAASKNRNVNFTSKSYTSRISNNNNHSSSKRKSGKKNILNNKNDSAKAKNVLIPESERTTTASIRKNSKLECAFNFKDTQMNGSYTADGNMYKKDFGLKSNDESTSSELKDSTAISKIDTSSFINEKIQSSPRSQSYPTSSKNHCNAERNTSPHPARGKSVKRNKNSNNFGFFSNKIPQRRCQNDTETSQISKSLSSRLSLKSNKKGSSVNDKKENSPLPDSKIKWKAGNIPCINSNSQNNTGSTSTETVTNQQSVEFALPPNIRIKSEPPDDYEVAIQSNTMKEALSCFDFDESSSSDPAFYLPSSSKRSHNSNDQLIEMSSKEKDVLLGCEKNKCKKTSKNENAPVTLKPSKSRKSSLVENMPSDVIQANNNTSFDSGVSARQNNNSLSNNRYPKRSCSFSSKGEDDVIILEDVPRNSIKSVKPKTRSSAKCLVSEVIDLEKEDDLTNVSPVITIKRHSDGNNSIIPNKRRRATSEWNLNNTAHALEFQLPSTSSSNNLTESASKNFDDGSDFKHGLKMTFQLKTIRTRNNEPKVVVVGRHFQDPNNDETNSADIIHIKEEPETESPKRKCPAERKPQRNSIRTNPYAPIVPPLHIKDIKKEKEDDYEKKPYVAPLKVNLSSLNVTEVKKPNTNIEPKLKPLMLYRKSKKVYAEQKSSHKKKHEVNVNNNLSNVDSTPPKRKRGRPAKVKKSSSPLKDISPLKNNSSFKGNSNAGKLTLLIPKKPVSEQSFDIDKKFSFSQPSKKNHSDADSNSPEEEWWTVNIKQEPKSDSEDLGSSSIAPCSQRNEATPVNKRRNSLRSERYKKYYDSDSDHSDGDRKLKNYEVKSRKRKNRSKSVGYECSKKTVDDTNEFSSPPNRRTSARVGSIKKYYNSDQSETSDDDCKILFIKKSEKPKKIGCRKRKRHSTTAKSKLCTTTGNTTLPINDCSVNLERLSPSLFEKNVSTKAAQNVSQQGRQKSVDSVISPNYDIQTIPESNSIIPESQHIAQMNSPELISSASSGVKYTSAELTSNLEGRTFNTREGKNIPAENSSTKFILDSGPVTINGLNSINMDSSLSEYLCDKMISENRMNCSPLLYNSPPLSTDSNIISNSNSSNFLRRTSREMDQCLFESPSNMLQNGNLDSQSPLLYSQSPGMDVKQISDLSPDNKYLHLNHLSPQAFKQQTDLIHNPVFNSETMFEHCSPPMKKLKMSNNAMRENLRTTDKDFNRGRQQRDMNTYYGSVSESHDESCRPIPSMIPSSKDKNKVLSNVSKGMHNPIHLHSKDFDRGQQHSSYTFINSPTEQNTEFLHHSVKGLVNYDKISNKSLDPLKTSNNSFIRRNDDIISFYSSSCSELMKPSEQIRHERSNPEKDHSNFSNSCSSSDDVRQSQKSHSTQSQNGYNNVIHSMIHSRSDETLNNLRNHDDYFDRMKWDNTPHFLKTNNSFCEDNKSQMNHFSVQQNRCVGYYPKPNNPNENSRTNNESYYRPNWQEVNTYFPHNDRSMYEFSPSDGSFNDFSLNERPMVEAIKKSPMHTELNKYTEIRNQVPRSLSTSAEEFHASKNTDVSFSHYSSYDCNPSKPRIPQPSSDKNTFGKNMEAFFRQPGFSSNSPNTMSPSAVSHSSPIGISQSPLKPDVKAAFKKEYMNSPESSGVGSKYRDIGEPSTDSFSDQTENVLSPTVTSNSSILISLRPLNSADGHKDEIKSPLIRELSADYPKDFGDFDRNSANSSMEIITIVSESEDDEYDLNVKSSSDLSHGPRQKDTETPTNDSDQGNVFRNSLDLPGDNSSFDLVSDEESYLTDFNVFSDSPQNKISESSIIPASNNLTVTVSDTVKSSLSAPSINQNTVPDLTPSTYDGSFDLRILGFSDCVLESDSELHLLPGDFDLSGTSSFLFRDNDVNKGNDESTKEELQTCLENSVQPISDVQNSCPLFVETVPNVNVIVTNTPESESTNAFLPLESFKNTVVSVDNSVKSDALCLTQPSTSATYDSVNPTFLPTLMVNESIVLPQPNFFFNNASFIISDNSAEEGSINIFPNAGTVENSSTNNISDDSKDTQKIQSLNKSFNNGDDILSMIVKSCDIGEEFDENFSPSEEAMDGVDTTELNNPSEKTEKASFLGLANGTDSYTIHDSHTSSPMNISTGVVSPASDNESVVHASHLSPQISESKSSENINSSSASLQQGNQTQSSQCLESCQEGSRIKDSVPLDSVVHSFYGEDTLYDLNSSTNCDILSYHCSSQYCDVPSIVITKNAKKIFHQLNDDNNIKMEKVISIIPPSRSSGLPGNGNLLLIVKSRPVSNKVVKFQHISVDKNNQLKIKEMFASPTDNEKISKRDTIVICPGSISPYYIRILIWLYTVLVGTGSLNTYKTDNSPKGPHRIRFEYTEIEDEFGTNSLRDNQLVLCRKLYSELDQTLVNTPSLNRFRDVLKLLLSSSVNLESTPSTNRPIMQKIQLKELNVSPISKDDFLTRSTRKRRRLSFDQEIESSEMLEEKNEKRRKLSVEVDNSKESFGSMTSSDIEGPTLVNSRGFRVNTEDHERVQHEAQHLTLMSLEIHVNTRNSLYPDPKNDPVSIIFYSIYNVTETFKQEVVGVIAVDNPQKDSSLKGNQAFKTNFLNIMPGVKTSQVFIVEDEKSAFEKLVCIVKDWDPDILIGYEIQMLSWGYLIERANILNINLTSMLSRLMTKKEEPKFEHVQEDNTVTDQTADIDRINIPGRIVLNLWRLLRKEVTLNMYSFENLCYHVLHRRIPCFTSMKLTEWILGRQKGIVVRFYVTRVLGTIQILEKLDTIRRTGEMARLFGIDFYEVLSRGSQFRVESMMLRTAAPLRYMPVSPSVQQRSHSRAPECVPLILEPESRFYRDPVVVLDFQSLYPSIMIAYNYCFSTCLGRLEHLGKDVPFEFGCTSLSVSPNLLQKLALEDNIHFSPQGIAFVKSRVRQGILPLMLEEILDARVMVKQSLKKIKNNNALKKLLDARQLGLKLIANVTYGYTGASFSGRMPCVEVADSIVGKARETLERAIKLIENTPKWRAKVVYGDTDSLFINLPGRSREEAFKLGYEIADAVTRTNPEPIKLKFEKVYFPCVLQAKKRYCGFMYETPDQKTPIFDAKGIETVRRDSCPATAKILEKSLKILFRTQNVNSVKNYVQKQFIKILKGRVNIQDFIFAKEYRGMSGYRPGVCVPALEIAKKRLAKDPRAEPRSGERVPYVVVYGYPGMPIIRLVHEPSDFLKDPNLRINATYYITRVISPPLERIFSLLGANVKSWYSELTHIHRLNLPMINHTKETITQYFAARKCPSCESPTNSSLCTACRQDWAGTVADLQIKIRDWQRGPHNLKQICVSCTKSSLSVDHCSSLDCPVLFKLYLANIDLAQAPYLRKILTREIRELF